MNRDHVCAELPPDAAAWMTAHASPDTWDAIARDVATATGQALLVERGTAAWDPGVYAALLAHRSPAVRQLAATLGHGTLNRRWSIDGVTRALIAYYGLHGSYKALSTRLSSASVAEFPIATAA